MHACMRGCMLPCYLPVGVMYPRLVYYDHTGSVRQGAKHPTITKVSGNTMEPCKTVCHSAVIECLTYWPPHSVMNLRLPCSFLINNMRAWGLTIILYKKKSSLIGNDGAVCDEMITDKCL